MLERFEPEAVRRDFPALSGIVHLNSASMGCPPRPALDAVEAQLRLLARGPSPGSWSRFLGEFERPVESARREAARLLGAGEGEVGLIADTTSGLHQAIDAVPFRRGDNVVLGDLEYPQVALAAQNAVREYGIEMRFVRHRNGRLAVDDYREAIDDRTRVVLLSSVGWVTGQRFDLAAFSQLAEERSFFLVVDAVQQLGTIGVDTSKLRIDFLASGGYKWLNAPFGCGLLYVRRETHRRGLRVRRVGLLGLEEPAGGWASFYGSPEMTPLPTMQPEPSVRRFELQGTPNRLGCAGLAGSLAYRNALPARAVETHVLELGAELIAELCARGATLWTPDRDGERAGIVTFTLGQGATADETLRRFLETRRVYVSARYCSGVGGVRVAIHFFNTRDDIARLLSAVDEFR